MNGNILEAIKRALEAMFFTNCQQMRGLNMVFFPSGDDSWCKFKNTESPGVTY
jgi:hypothetical protein